MSEAGARRVSPDVAVLVALVAASVVPLFAGRYLPFYDYPAHLTVPAALRWRSVPDSHVAAWWSFAPALVPNSIHYLFTWAGSYVVSMETASRIFVALFAVAALPVSMVYALRTFGRDWRLATLAVPFAWNRGLWYGFIGHCAALSISMVMIAIVDRELRAPSRKRAVALGALAALLPFVHFFIMLVTVALGAVVLLLRVRAVPLKRSLRVAALLAPGPLAMGPWVWGRLHAGAGAAAAAEVPQGTTAPPLRELVRVLHHWFMEGYTGPVDDIVAVVLLSTLAALFAFAAPSREVDGAPGVDAGARRIPLFLGGALALGYFLLPFEIHRPFFWWALNVRLIPLAFLWLIVAAPPGPLGRLGRGLLIPLAATSLAFFAFIAWDIGATFNGPWGMGGFDGLVARIPRGARVLGLYTDYYRPPRYTHYPFYYASSYAFVNGGGLVAPTEVIHYSWTNPIEPPAAPFAGDAARFDFDAHAPGFSHFLVRTCAGARCVSDPLEGRGEVMRVSEAGSWRLYACVRAPCLPARP